MGQKKGNPPAPIQPKVFSHPQAEFSWIAVPEKVNDPSEISCNTHHSVTSIFIHRFYNYFV